MDLAIQTSTKRISNHKHKNKKQKWRVESPSDCYTHRSLKFTISYFLSKLTTPEEINKTAALDELQLSASKLKAFLLFYYFLTLFTFSLLQRPKNPQIKTSKP
jgi:hypothetical protein